MGRKGLRMSPSFSRIPLRFTREFTLDVSPGFLQQFLRNSSKSAPLIPLGVGCKYFQEILRIHEEIAWKSLQEFPGTSFRSTLGIPKEFLGIYCRSSSRVCPEVPQEYFQNFLFTNFSMSFSGLPRRAHREFFPNS